MGPGGDEDREGQRDGGDEGRDDEPLGPEEEKPHGAPPDRMDRLWVHPAELSPVSPPAKRSRAATLALPLAAGALGAVAAVVVLGLVGAFAADTDPTTVRGAEERAAENDDVLSALTEAVAPGLVVVTVKDANGARQSTGVCVRHRGEILTSARTLGASATADVTTATGDTLTAVVLGRDDVTDLALLSTDQPLRAVTLSEGTSRAGDSVWIFGAHPPGQASPWISDGIVSSVESLVATAPGPMIGGLLETDALSTNWAAGGALVDRTGAVSGIVLWPLDGTRSSYAMPIGRAIAIANELRDNGYVAHGTIDIEVQDTPTGPLVTGVAPESPAGSAGMQSGDRIIAIDGREVLSVAQLQATVHAYGPGNVVEVRVQRAEEPMKMDVKLASTTPNAPAPAG